MQFFYFVYDTCFYGTHVIFVPCLDIYQPVIWFKDIITFIYKYNVKIVTSIFFEIKYQREHDKFIMNKMEQQALFQKNLNTSYLSDMCLSNRKDNEQLLNRD